MASAPHEAEKLLGTAPPRATRQGDTCARPEREADRHPARLRASPKSPLLQRPAPPRPDAPERKTRSRTCDHSGSAPHFPDLRERLDAMLAAGEREKFMPLIPARRRPARRSDRADRPGSANLPERRVPSDPPRQRCRFPACDLPETKGSPSARMALREIVTRKPMSMPWLAEVVCSSRRPEHVAPCDGD